jgi:hypothetical protein
MEILKPLVLSLLVLAIGCTGEESGPKGDPKFSKSNIVSEETTSREILIAIPPGQYTVKTVLYESGTAFNLRHDKLIGRVDVIVDYDPPDSVNERIELVEQRFARDIKKYLDAPELKVVSQKIDEVEEFDLNSKIVQNAEFMLPDRSIVNGQTIYIRSIAYFDDYFFHVLIQGESKHQLEKFGF